MEYKGHDINDLCRIIAVTMVKTLGEGMQVLSSPLEIDEVIQTIPKGEAMSWFKVASSI